MVRLLAILASAALCAAVSAMKVVHDADSVSGSSSQALCSQVPPTTDQCTFVKQHCQAKDDGRIAYLQFYYCTMNGAKPGAWLALLSWTAILFATLGVCASDFFAVNLSSVARTLNLSDTLAGVTLLAIGNGGPDLFSTWAAMSSNRPALAVGELVGAATFITTIVAGSLPFVTEFRVRNGSLLRDALFLLATAALLLSALITREFQLWHGIVMLVLYLIYVLCVCGYHWWVSRVEEHGKNESEADRENEVCDEEAARSAETQPLLDNHTERQAMDHSSHESKHAPAALYRDIEAWRRAHGRCVTSGRDYMVQPSLVGSWEYHWRQRRAADSDQQQHERPKRRLAHTDDQVQRTLFPAMRDLGARNLWHIIVNIVTAVPFCLLRLTVPVVDNEHGEDCDHGWNRWLLLIQGFTAPQLIWAVIWTAGDTSREIDSWLVPALYCALGSVVFALCIVVCTSSYHEPRWYPLLSIVGFIMGAFWLSTIADELVSIMQAFGIILGISQAILGFTVFAIGNCLDDWVANVTVSQHGHPVMALAACFGGPLLNILLGLGSSIIYVVARGARQTGTVTPIQLNIDWVLIVSTVVLGLTVILILLLLRWNKWRLNKRIGIILTSLWVLLTVSNVVLEFV